MPKVIVYDSTDRETVHAGTGLCTRAVHARILRSTPFLWHNEGDRVQRPSDFCNACTGEGVNGWNVVKVEFGQGTFIKHDATTWKEYSGHSCGSPVATFNEIFDRNDGTSVFLSDPSRGVDLVLDLHTEKVYYSDLSSPQREQYTITDTFALP